ncbi:MAG: hypothetical protein IAE90_06095 [Ignavibacteria bacterium]|nr:hypothetical protein [Ignavibacteria bacterium]
MKTKKAKKTIAAIVMQAFEQILLIDTDKIEKEDILIGRSLVTFSKFQLDAVSINLLFIVGIISSRVYSKGAITSNIPAKYKLCHFDKMKAKDFVKLTEEMYSILRSNKKLHNLPLAKAEKTKTVVFDLGAKK